MIQVNGAKNALPYPKVFTIVFDQHTQDKLVVAGLNPMFLHLRLGHPFAGR